MLRQVTGSTVYIDGLAECLLAFQFCERDDDGLPTDRARLGALWHAEQSLNARELPRVLVTMLSRTRGRG